jgi:thiamine-phosphate pyrophosphorylase
LPALWLVTDPARIDPLAAAKALPPGGGIIYRAFGAADALEVGRALRRIADRRKLVLLAGADEALARAIGADGLHLPERLVSRAPIVRARHRGWMVTGAAHSNLALVRARRARVDAAVLSPAFTSRSPSAGAPIGPVRLAIWIRRAGLPVIALGGVRNETAPGLVRTGAHGLAAVEGLKP